MTLTLTIRNMERLENGVPAEFVLHRRGGVIGRAPTCDWCLPDTTNYISSRHCEISFRDEQYVLTDISTNGTYLNGSDSRMPAAHQLRQDDVLQIGQYEVVARLSGAAAASQSAAAEAAANAAPAWRGWTNEAAPQPDNQGVGGWGAPAPNPGPPPAPPPASSGPLGWGAVPGAAPSRPAPFGGAAPSPAPAPRAAGWDPSHRAPVASVWEEAPPPPDRPSGWSSAAPDQPPPPSPDDVWGKLAADNVVDWARSGFGVQAPADPLGLDRDPAASLPKAPSSPRGNAGWGAEAESTTAPPLGGPPSSPAGWGPDAGRGVAQPPAAPEPYRAPPPANMAPGAELDSFLAALGLDRQQMPNASAATLTSAARVLKRLVAGLTVMVDARAKAKAQLGAEATSFQFDGNNPIKFARTPEQALAQLLSPPQRGFMDAERAVEDAFFDLQSHQMAMLKAMQGALRATLARFSPTAIQQRAENNGILARIVPAARDAALWQNYQREFSGVAQGSDEAFMDVFAKEFRTAYEEQARLQRPR